jgi:hypothetical protein
VFVVVKQTVGPGNRERIFALPSLLPQDNVDFRVSRELGDFQTSAEVGVGLPAREVELGGAWQEKTEWGTTKTYPATLLSLLTGTGGVLNCLPIGSSPANNLIDTKTAMFLPLGGMLVTETTLSRKGF